MTRLRASVSTAAAVVTLVALASCGGDDGSSDAFSVERLLDQVPESTLEDGWLITTADLDRASELADVDRPRPQSDDEDDVANWGIVISGLRSEDDDTEAAVAALIPEAVNPQRLLQAAEFRDEVGWTVLDVASFIEVSAPPARFTVLNGEFDLEAIDDALGARDDDIWSVGGDDFEIDPSASSAARPLGEALRFAEDDGTLVVSKSTEPVEQWLGDDGTLADDEQFAAVGAALDEHGVYSAMIVEGVSVEEGTDDGFGTALDPFDLLGVGLDVDDDGNAVAVFVYQFGDDDEAGDNVEILEELFDDGVSARNREPLADFFDGVTVEADGSTLVATAEIARDRPARLVWSLVFTRELLTAHR